ncbi:MAG: phosphate signaling complex protein PhoU [Lentisphaerae bacterium]|nr:phosphate signaling complex protein PhoU [Lentisphaerota bacterium]
MRVHLQRDLDVLKRRLLELGAIVERDLDAAICAVERRDCAAAQSVIDRGARIDELEIEVEEECLKILALHQPVASDLRFIVSVLKIDRDLERIGDIAEHIAKRGLILARLPQVGTAFPISEMGRAVRAMLDKALHAFVGLDAVAAMEVCEADSMVNGYRNGITRQVRDIMERNPEMLEQLLQTMNVVRHLERVADHVTNIAEGLIYMADGRIVRHSGRAGPPAQA